MSLSVLLSFVLSSLILAIAPGPDNIFVLTQSALYGVKRGLAVIAGLCLGIVLQTLCLVVGLTAFITAIPALMIGLKLAGVAYLLYLAYKSIIYARSVAKIDLASDGAAHNQVEVLTYGKLVRRGFIMNITNPKVQLFFLSFFPQFLPQGVAGATLMGYMALLGFIFTLATIVVFAAVAVFSGALASQFKSVKFNLCLNYSAAIIFIGLAIFTLMSAFE